MVNIAAKMELCKFIVNTMCLEVIKSIKDNNMKISNEKQLKNEIATFIYRRSHV